MTFPWEKANVIKEIEKKAKRGGRKKNKRKEREFNYKNKTKGKLSVEEN